jgi:hypothetical protein
MSQKCFCQDNGFNHSLYCQILDHDFAVLVNIRVSCFMQKVTTLIADFSMGPGNQDTSFISIMSNNGTDETRMNQYKINYE